jgi:hypothetical protein
MAGQVPKAYAAQTLRQGQQELQKERNKIAALALLAAERDKLSSELQGIEEVIGKMHTAVQRGDQGGLEQQMRILAQQQQTIAALIKGRHGQP